MVMVPNWWGCSQGSRDLAQAGAVGGDRHVEGHVTLRRAKAQESLLQRAEDRPRVAGKPGTEVLRAIEYTGGLQELDAAVDLVHVVADAERIVRKLSSHVQARCMRCRDRCLCLCDALFERPDRAEIGQGRAGGIVRLARTAA